jgi:hypothetical protein
MGFALDLLDSRVYSLMDTPKVEAIVQAYVKAVTMHELGHTLGLRHNFRASSVYALAQLHDSAFTKTSGLAGSVMDYFPMNLAAAGQAQGEYYMSTIGPYDYWAIEYAYKPIPADKEAEELKRIAARSTEPLLAYGSDEELYGVRFSDPTTSAWDLGADPFAFAQLRLNLARELWAGVQSKKLAEGEDYDSLRRGLSYGFSQYEQAFPMIAKFVGGSYTWRDRSGTGRAPFAVVEVKKQRQALKLIADSLFNAKSVTFNHDFLSRLGTDYFDRSVLRSDTSVTSRVLAMQSDVLDTLMSEPLATRVLIGGERVGDPKKAMSLTELYGTLQSSIWGELSTGVDITATRRNLQREHLKRLTTILLRPANGAAADMRSIQRKQANKLVAAIRTASTKSGFSAEAKAHLSESLSTLTEVLNASITRAGS